MTKGDRDGLPTAADDVYLRGGGWIRVDSLILCGSRKYQGDRGDKGDLHHRYWT